MSRAPTLGKEQAPLLGTAPGPGGERSNPGPRPGRPAASAILDCGPPVPPTGPLGHGVGHLTPPAGVSPSDSGKAAKPRPRPPDPAASAAPVPGCLAGPASRLGPAAASSARWAPPPALRPSVGSPGSPRLSEAHPAPRAPDQVTPVTAPSTGLRAWERAYATHALHAHATPRTHGGRGHAWGRGDARRTRGTSGEGGGTRGGLGAPLEAGAGDPRGKRLAAERALIP